MIVYVILILLSMHLCGIEYSEHKEETVMIKTSDDAQDTISKSALLTCNTFYNAQEICDDSAQGIFPIPVDSKKWPIVKKSILASYLLQKKDINKELQQRTHKQLEEDLKDKSELHAVLCAANYLDNQFLLEECTRLWAKKEYTIDKEHPLPLELDIKIASKMEKTQKLLDAIPLLILENPEQKKSLVVQTFKPQQGPLWSVAVSEDGTLIAGGHESGIISLYDKKQRKGGIIQASCRPITMLRFIGKDIFSSSCHETITRRNIKTAQEVFYYSPLVHGFTFCYGPQTKTLIADAKDHKVCFWDLKNQVLEFADAHHGNINSLEMSDNEDLFVSASDDTKVIVWETKQKKGLLSLRHNDSVLSANFDHDNTTLVAGLENGEIFFYDIATGKKICEKQGHSASIWSVVFAHTQNRLAYSGSHDGSIALWDTRTYNPVQKKLIASGEVQYMTIEKNSEILYSASNSGVIKGWDLRNLIVPIITLTYELSNNVRVKTIHGLSEKSDKSGKLFASFSPQAKKILLASITT